MGDSIRNFLAVKSAIIGLLVLCLWGRSYFVGDEFHKGGATQYVQINSGAGTTIFTFAHDGQKMNFGGDWKHAAFDEPPAVLKDVRLGDTPLNRMGIGLTREVVDFPTHMAMVKVMLPHWLVFLLAIPSAVRWVIRRYCTQEEPAPPMKSCSKCGMMFGILPHSCPVCGQMLAGAAMA